MMFPREAYDLLKNYPDNYVNPDWAMDIRHIMILHNLLIAGAYKRVLEIGSHYGASTTAFIEAMRSGCLFELHLCDTCFLQPVKAICEGYHRTQRVHYHECMSSEFLPNAPTFDFAFVDGSHIAEHVQDDFELLSMNKTPSYFLHDTMTQLLPESEATPWYDGPMLLRSRLLSSNDWLCLEDSADRDGELTKRGVLFATRDINQYTNAKKVFEYWASCNMDFIAG